MPRIGCKHRVSFERGSEGEYILKIVPPRPTGAAASHLRQAKREALMAVRAAIDQTLEAENTAPEGQ